MKTTKFENRKRNTGLIAVILIMSLLSVNVFGENINTVTKDTELENTEAFEEEMQTEKWMMDINDQSWVQETEEEIQLEDWMLNLDDKVWSTYNSEEEIEVEEWMLNPSEWLN